MPEDSFAAISDWVVQASLEGLRETEIIEEMCRQLNESGLSLMRLQVGQRVLHPVYAGMGPLRAWRGR